MCLLIAVRNGVEKSSDFLFDAIRNGAVTNTDGIGYAYKKANQNKIWISKGFKDVEKFINNLKKKHLKLEDELIIHLRIGNKGAKSVEMNHPFVISNDSDTILSNDAYTDLPIVAHNGTFHGYSTYQSIYSDTYFFVKDFLSIPEIQMLLKRDLKTFLSVFDTKLSTNRLAFIFPDKTPIITIGEFKEDQGYLFSNESYKDRTLRNVGGVSVHYPSNYNRPRWQEWGEDDDVIVNRNSSVTGSGTTSISGFGTQLNLPVPLTDNQKKINEIISQHNCKIGERKRDSEGKLEADSRFDIIPPGLDVVKKRPIFNLAVKLYLYPVLGDIVWTPLKYRSGQFDSEVFIPTVFNYSHFTYFNSLGNEDKGISSRLRYKIQEFDDKDPFNGKELYHLIAPEEYSQDRWVKGITDIIWMNSKDIVTYFACHINNEMRIHYYTVHRLCQKFSSPSKNLYNQVNKAVRGAMNKDKTSNITFKHLDGLTLTGLKIWANYISLTVYPYEVASRMFFEVQTVDKSISIFEALEGINQLQN